MKVKKIQLLRPEFEVDFKESPILGRLYFAFAVLPRLIKVKRAKINLDVPSKIHKYAGTIYKFRVWFIFIPKIKVVKSV